MPNQGQSSKNPLTENGAEQGLQSAGHQRRIRTACIICDAEYSYCKIKLVGGGEMLSEIKMSRGLINNVY